MGDLTSKAALESLVVKVMAGEATTMDFDDALNAVSENPFVPDLAEQAYSGSLDAAKSLHENMLDGWSWTIVNDDQPELWNGKFGANKIEIVAGWMSSTNQARSWLIAILKALIAMEAPDA